MSPVTGPLRHKVTTFPLPVTFKTTVEVLEARVPFQSLSAGFHGHQARPPSAALGPSTGRSCPSHLSRRGSWTTLPSSDVKFLGGRVRSPSDRLPSVIRPPVTRANVAGLQRPRCGPEYLRRTSCPRPGRRVVCIRPHMTQAACDPSHCATLTWTHSLSHPSSQQIIASLGYQHQLAQHHNLC